MQMLLESSCDANEARATPICCCNKQKQQQQQQQREWRDCLLHEEKVETATGEEGDARLLTYRGQQMSLHRRALLHLACQTAAPFYRCSSKHKAAAAATTTTARVSLRDAVSLEGETDTAKQQQQR